ncbi:MAG: hypothetical protein PVJ64_09095 [Gemmatimonadales bacterium]
MKGPLTCLILIAVAVDAGWAQYRGPPSQGQQAISAEAMRHAGIRRLGEIFMLIDDWDVTTIQGFTWGASPHGLASYTRPGWTLMQDGQIVDLACFGVRSLDRLPVMLSQIDSVTFVSTPGLRDGMFVESGTVHIHMRRPKRGFSLRAQGVTANETGDPGPYRFTELGTPNVDRVGSGGSAAASYAGDRFYMEIGGLFREHFVTDLPIRERNFDISVEYPIIKQGAASLRAGLDVGASRHTLYLGHSYTRDYYFLKQFGREVPVESPFTHIGIDGTLRTRGAVSLRYRLAYSANTLAEHENSLDLDYDWTLSRWRAELEASRNHRSNRAKLGLSLDAVSAETGYSLSDDGFALLRAFGELAYRLSPTHDEALAWQLTTDSEDLGFRAALTHRWRPTPDHQVEVVIAYSERIPAEDDRIWYWYRRGYRFLPDNGVTVAVDGEPGTARTASADLRWTARLNDGLKVRVGGYSRSASGLSLEDQPFQFDSASGAFSGPVRLVTGRSGEIGGAELGADWAPLPQLEIGSHYRFQDVLGGDEQFEDTWRTLPKHRLRITTLYIPWESFSFRAALRYRSSSEWADYRDADEQSDGAYSSKLDDAFVLDLAAQKWLWQHHLRLHLSLRNLFDDAVPHHPIGPGYGLTFAVQGELRLDGL